MNCFGRGSTNLRMSWLEEFLLTGTLTVVLVGRCKDVFRKNHVKGWTGKKA
jgi:hypothetical protein